MNQEQPPGNGNMSPSQGYRIDAVRQLASGIAHEFANALTAISGIAYLLKNELTLDRQSEEDLNEIRTITEQAAFHARELMAFASNTANQPARRDLSDVAKQLRRVLPHVLPPHIRVEERLAPYDIVAWTDPQQTIELAIVVAVHARSALPHGGELLIHTTTMKVGVETVDRTVAPGSYAVLEIVTSGHQRADQRQPMMEALADVAGALTHSGGGLSVQHDDRADTTTFRMFLPLAEDVATEEKAPPDQPPEGTQTILVVEDDEILAQVIGRMLRVRGYTVLHANNGDAALETAETFEGAIHVLLSDVVIPGTNGLELVRQLMAIRPDVRVLLMSGQGPPVLGEHLPFIRKPFGPEVLSQKLRDILE